MVKTILRGALINKERCIMSRRERKRATISRHSRHLANRISRGGRVRNSRGRLHAARLRATAVVFHARFESDRRLARVFAAAREKYGGCDRARGRNEYAARDRERGPRGLRTSSSHRRLTDAMSRRSAVHTTKHRSNRLRRPDAPRPRPFLRRGAKLRLIITKLRRRSRRRSVPRRPRQSD